MQNAALRWENMGGTGWEGSSNAQRDGQTQKRAPRHGSGTGWGAAVGKIKRCCGTSRKAVLAGCEKRSISSLQHWPGYDVLPKETAGSTFMLQ